jgi:hypothetical protein
MTMEVLWPIKDVASKCVVHQTYADLSDCLVKFDPAF